MKTLTVFTPAYNRKHTIGRTCESLLRQTCKDVQWLIIDDGSTDGTMDWVQTLGSGSWVQGIAYDWMGRKTNERGQYYVVDVPFADGDGLLHVTFIHKPNGGLYTGYNVAYDHIQTELCVCIDSDDFAPDDMVEKVVKLWKEKGSEKYAGINGLDFNVRDSKPIGGYFPKGLKEINILELKHHGDTKQIMCTELMRTVAPQIGFEGEKDFNPNYMQMQILDMKPMLILNQNICWVEYQIGADSMSQAIFKQFRRSPRSYAKYRIIELKLHHGNSIKNKMRLCAHYVSSCIFSHNKRWLKDSPEKILTVLSIPIALVLNVYIRYKANQ